MLTSLKRNFIDFPLYVISSPFKAFDDIKYQNMGKKHFAVVMLLLFVVYNICDQVFKGFIVAKYYVKTPFINIPYTAAISLLPILLFVVANWSITSITDGKGKMKEILIVVTYALYPKIILSFIGLILSNVVTIEEVAFVDFFMSFGNVAFGLYLFIGLVIIHEYTFTKSVVMVILTIFSMLIIVFVIGLLLSLSTEVYFFFYTVFKELMIRLA